MKICTLRKLADTTLVLALALVNWSCGSGGTPPPPVGVPSGKAYVFIGDAPPVSTSVLKFQISLTNAALCPTVSATGECQGTPQVSLISAPVDIELEQLELQSAYLSLESVQAGTYAGVQLTFASPELKLLLADGTVQTLEASALPLSPATVTPLFTNGLTVSANSNMGFLVDFNLRDSIQSSGTTITGISPVVSLVQLPTTAQQTIEDLDDTTGKVSSLAKTCPTGSFTLLDSLTGLAIANISFDSTTGLAGLNCDTLANDQIVEANLELRTPTSQTAQFFATEIELVNDAGGEGMEGAVFQVNSATQFVLLVQKAENLPNVPSGSFVTVTTDPAKVQFGIDAGDLPVDTSLFATGADLLAGQQLEVDVTAASMVVAPTGCVTIADNCTASADKLKLKKGTLIGQVAGTNPPNFTLGTLPSLFGSASLFRPLSADCQSCAIGSLNVVTSTVTEFADGLTGVSGLVVNDTVITRGLLLKNGFAGPGPISGFPPQFVAAKVRRPAP